MGGSCVSVVSGGTSEDFIMILRISLFLWATQLVHGKISKNDKRGFTDSMNDFTQDFLAVSWEELGENYVFSPFSLHSVLAMLTTGATDGSKTQEQLLTGFGRGRNIEVLEKLYKKIVEEYKKPDMQEMLTFGNRVWTTSKYFEKILESYKTKIQKLYDGQFEELQAQNGEVAINRWVNKTTKGKISNIVDSVDPNTAALIVNALYFKAPWAKSFDDGEEQEFTILSTRRQRKIIRMMTRDSQKQAVATFSTSLVQGKSDQVLAVAKPYKHPNDAVEPGRFEMLIIMPEHHLGLLYFWQKAKKSVGDSSFEGNIIELALQALETKAKGGLSPRENPRNYVINMPEFKMDSNIGAVGFLQESGIQEVFTSGEFDEMIADENLKVSNVKHRAAIEVTKEGTLGVAASSVELVALSGATLVSKTVNINKPFLFFVRDTELNAILFAGKYSNPDGNRSVQ